MALTSNKSVIGVEVQSSAGTFNTPNSSTDTLPCANISLSEAGVTIENPEYTGSIHKQGNIVAGSTVTLSLDIMLRPPGGVAPPAADGFLPGRFLRAAKFTETVLAAAVPAAPEAVSAGSTVGATLGAGVAATADLYKGMSIVLASQGVVPRSLSAIKSYSAGKAITLPETLGGTLTGNYQIPAQLAYVRDVTQAAPPFLSLSVWLGGVRYDLVDMSVASASFVVPTSTRDQAAFPVFRVTLSGDVFATADEATPTIPALGAIPLFKDGDFWVANKALGGASFNIDLNARVAAPPNPNKVNGSDAPETVEMRPSVSLQLQKYLKATFDARALAAAQSSHSVWAQWGYTAGSIVSLLVAEARFNFPNPELGGDFITENVDLFIDVATKNISVCFPYPA
jgi:hypothetical protein